MVIIMIKIARRKSNSYNFHDLRYSEIVYDTRRRLKNAELYAVRKGFKPMCIVLEGMRDR